MVSSATRTAASSTFECSAINIPFGDGPAASPSVTRKYALSLILAATDSPSPTSNDPSATPPATSNVRSSIAFILSRSPTSPSVGTSLASQSRPQLTTINAMHSLTRLKARCNTTSDCHHASSTPANNDTVLQVKKGPRFCVVDGCLSLGKHNRRCWRHGGSKKCKVAFCANRAKTRGLCWSHGGGTLCRVDKCGTIAVSKGFCWAHGGGKRCLAPHCLRPGYERTQNCCVEHFRAMRGSRNARLEWIV